MYNKASHSNNWCLIYNNWCGVNKNCMFGVSTAKIQNSYPFSTHTGFNFDQEGLNNNGGILQNGHITHFYFNRLKQQQLALSIIVVIHLYLIICQTNISFPTIDDTALFTLQMFQYFSFGCTAIEMLLITMRAVTMLELEKQQKQIYQKAGLVSSKKILYLMWEWAFLLLQPYPFLTDSSFTTSNAYSDDPIQYPINDILAILSFTKVYILVRTALFLTPYMNNRSNRLCKMYGCRADYSYALKCLLKDHPFKLITLLYFTTASILAYLVYLAERQLLVQSSGQLQAGACTDYQNALWLILITTTTVGYGDYFPQTPMGRTIIVFVAIWGTLIISITVVLVSNTLTMKHSQVRTSKILNKLELRQQLQQKARKFIGWCMLAHLGRDKLRSRRNILEMVKAKKDFQQTRKKMKELQKIDNLQQQIATHFLKINKDTEILNKNQDRIIQYIHQNFNAKPQKSSQENQSESDSQSLGSVENIEPNLMQLFKKELKMKLV